MMVGHRYSLLYHLRNVSTKSFPRLGSFYEISIILSIELHFFTRPMFRVGLTHCYFHVGAIDNSTPLCWNIEMKYHRVEFEKYSL